MTLALRSRAGFAGRRSWHERRSRMGRSESLKLQRLDGRHDEGGIVLPVDAGDIDVELDLVPVGVGDVEAVADRVVARTHDGDLVLLQPGYGLPQRLVVVADLP